MELVVFILNLLLHFCTHERRAQSVVDYEFFLLCTRARQQVMEAEEQVVTVEVDVKAEEDSPDGGEPEETSQREGGETETAATSQEPEPKAEPTKQEGEDSGSEDEQAAAGKGTRFAEGICQRKTCDYCAITFSLTICTLLYFFYRPAEDICRL